MNLWFLSSCVMMLDTMTTAIKTSSKGSMEQLVSDKSELVQMPNVGEKITGRIIDKMRNAMYVDLGSLGVGVIYGRDLLDDLDTFRNASIGDEVQATIQRYDNEDDYVELSLRAATREKSWEELSSMLNRGEAFETEILDANKGGLIVRVKGITGFLPVSQLSQEHYPRVEGGDKTKILSHLKGYVGEKFKVKVLAADMEDEKLIVSEKAAVSDELSGLLEKIEVGREIEGTVSGVVDFGVFVKFKIEESDQELEGLVHISELAWQRIDDPSDFVSPGETVRTKVIGIDGTRISLSVKQLQEDPWKYVHESYKVGDEVEGEVIKVTPFGGFVKLDEKIHGLIHSSELPKEAQNDPGLVLKAKKKIKFTIISLEPTEHRLGLSVKSQQKEDKGEDKDKAREQKQTAADTTKKSTKEKDK